MPQNVGCVALRKESVDRNLWAWTGGLSYDVALRKESVDRNLLVGGRRPILLLSLSARRAWIEIRNGVILDVWVCVALRKESVDRNCRS